MSTTSGQAAPGKIKIQYLNVNGGAYSDWVEVPAGTTLNAFLQIVDPQLSPNDFHVRYDRNPVAVNKVNGNPTFDSRGFPEYVDIHGSPLVLQHGKAVTVTPTKGEGGGW